MECDTRENLQCENADLRVRLAHALQGLLLSEESVKGYAMLLDQCREETHVGDSAQGRTTV